MEKILALAFLFILQLNCANSLLFRVRIKNEGFYDLRLQGGLNWYTPDWDTWVKSSTQSRIYETYDSNLNHFNPNYTAILGNADDVNQQKEISRISIGWTGYGFFAFNYPISLFNGSTGGGANLIMSLYRCSDDTRPEGCDFDRFREEGQGWKRPDETIAWQFTVSLLVLVESPSSIYGSSFVQHHSQMDVMNSTIDLARNCFFRTPQSFNSSWAYDGMTFSYNAFGWMNRNVNRFTYASRDKSEAESLVDSNKYTKVACGHESDMDLVIFCQKERGECVPTVSSTLYGMTKYTHVAVKFRETNMWCSKFGYGPLLCTQHLDDMQNSMCQYDTVGKPNLGVPGLCYKLR